MRAYITIMSVSEQIAEQIEVFLRRRKLHLDISLERLEKQIRQYIDMRRRGGPLSISNPKNKPTQPEGWDDQAEQVWQEWFSNNIRVEDWLREVFRPVLGQNTCRYDGAMDGWREELLAFLPWWARRSYSIVDAYDATPYDSDEEELTDPWSSKVDPYLADRH